VSRAAATARTIEKEAEKISSDAGQLLAKADLTYKNADALHHAISETHLKSKRLHSRSASSEPPGGDVEIVTEESPRPTAKPFPIVGIGASAGGYEAFAEFLAKIPKNSGMAFVLVQHLDPKHKSRLSELLGHSTKVPVLEAENDMEVEPDHVYVIPENTNMTISGGRLRLSPRQERESPPMPIDVFFRSLAQHQQERAIAVVLSGTGTDGTLGVEAVKGEGGITFAQDDRSAKYFGMPGSAISAGSVDFVLAPAAMAAELARIATHPYVGRAARGGFKPRPRAAVEPLELEKLLSERSQELQTVFGLLRARNGVDFSFYKHSTLKRRIIRRMILHKIDTIANYIRFLEKDPGEVDALFKDLLINVTSFFRDAQAFQSLKSKVFPRLIKAHADDLPLRMWVCGCATGEEAYSLAMSVMEYFEQSKTHRQVQIFATDISDTGIEKARAGIYPENISQDVSSERLRRFFSKVNGNYQVHKSICDMCVFARQNVLVDPPFSNLDLICCRNVLIYFGPLLQRRIVPIFHYALRQTGYLMLGNSETIGPSADLFTLVNKKYKIYSKRPSFLKPQFEMGHRPRVQAKEIPPEGSRPARESNALDLQQHVDKILLRDFSPGVVVVTSDFEVVQFRGRTGDYLEHAPGTPSLNLLKLARESLIMDLRTALNKAARSDMTVKQTSKLRTAGHAREVLIEVAPFKMGAERFFLVAFKEPELTPATEAGQSAKEDLGGKTVREQRELGKLKLELAATKESMQSIIEEQEATNEELKSANEEIQSSNEELQSTNEELETAKEELQSTNEELTTLNEELQNRNAELSQANNDLTNLLASVNIAILMLGEDLTIRRFTPMAERIFNLIPSDIGRRLGDMNRAILVPDLEGLVRQVLDTLTPMEREVQDRDAHWYSLRIRPYRTRENKIDGAVILLVDIDEINRALDGISATITQPLLILGFDMRVRNTNEAFRKLFGVTAPQVHGHILYEIGDGQWDKAELRTLLEEALAKNKHVANFELDAELPDLGTRKLSLNARRFYEEGRGIQIILLAIEDKGGG